MDRIAYVLAFTMLFVLALSMFHPYVHANMALANFQSSGISNSITSTTASTSSLHSTMDAISIFTPELFVPANMTNTTNSTSASTSVSSILSSSSKSTILNYTTILNTTTLQTTTSTSTLSSSSSTNSTLNTTILTTLNTTISSSTSTNTTVVTTLSTSSANSTIGLSSTIIANISNSSTTIPFNSSSNSSNSTTLLTTSSTTSLSTTTLNYTSNSTQGLPYNQTYNLSLNKSYNFSHMLSMIFRNGIATQSRINALEQLNLVGSINLLQQNQSYLLESNLTALNSTQLSALLSNFSRYAINNTILNITLPYGTPMRNGSERAAGTRLNYLVYGAAGVTDYAISLSKIEPNLGMSIDGAALSSPNSSIVIHYPVIDGRNYYNVKGSLDAQLTNPNMANFSYSINGRTSHVYNANSVDIPIAISDIPIGQNTTITFDTSGDQNYTAEDPTIIIIPTNIVELLPITLQNSQASSYPANAQVEIPFNALNYSQFLTSNLINGEFFYANGSIIPSWLEGNTLNEYQNTNLYESANILYWVLIKGSENFLCADCSNTIYLGWAGNVSTPQNALMDGVITGEAPQLAPSSSQYGSLDNGANVFILYQNFKGTTTPAGWTSSGTAFTVSNGLKITGSVTIYNALRVATGNIIEANFHITTLGSGTNAGGGGFFFGTDYKGGPVKEIRYKTFSTSASNDVYNGAYIAFRSGAYSYSSSAATHSNISVSFGTTPVNSVIGLSIQPGASAIVFMNGTLAGSTATDVASANSFHISLFGNSSTTSSRYYLNWTRVRAYPPSGIPASVSFNAPYIKPNVSIVSAIKPVLNVGQTDVFTADVSGGSAPFTYNFLVFNSVTKDVIANYTGSLGEFAWNVSANDVGNTVHANVTVTDAASNTFNSPYNPRLITIAVNSTIKKLMASNSLSLPNTLTINSVSTNVPFEAGNIIVDNITTQYQQPNIGNVYANHANLVYPAVTYINLTNTYNTPIAINAIYFKAVNNNPNFSSINLYQFVNESTIINQTMRYTGGGGAAQWLNVPAISNVPFWQQINGNVLLLSSGLNRFKVTGNVLGNVNYTWEFEFSTANVVNVSNNVALLPLQINYTNLFNASVISQLGLANINTNQTITIGNYTISSNTVSTYNVAAIKALPQVSINIDPSWQAPTQTAFVLNVSLQNNQPTAILPTEPVAITVNSIAYNAYFNSKLTNYEIFNGITGNILYSWLERGNNNALAPNALIWVSLPAQIAASTTAVNVISIAFLPMSVTSMNGNNVGEAPELSTNYGQYDNGANVFTHYTNFECSTGVPCAAPSGWTNTITNSIVMSTYFRGNVIINNGLTIVANTLGSTTTNNIKVGFESNWPVIGNVVDEYVSYANVIGANAYAQLFISSNSATAASFIFSNSVDRVNTITYGNTLVMNDIFGAAGAANIITGGNIIGNAPGKNVITFNTISVYASNVYGFNSATDSPEFYSNGNELLYPLEANSVDAINVLGGAGNLYLALGANDTHGGTNTKNVIFTVNWIRVRVPTPGDIMPNTVLSSAVFKTAVLTLSNTSIDQGQSILFTASTESGPASYSYNFLIVNSITNAVIVSQLYTGVASATNTFFWTPPNALYTGNTFKANVIITDGLGGTTNSAYSPIGYNSQPIITKNSISNVILDAGQTTVFTVTDAGGTGKFNAELFNITGLGQQGVNVLVTAGGTNTIPIISGATGTFQFNWTLTDTGTTTPFVFNSISNSITVNPAMTTPILLASNTAMTQGQYTTLTALFSGGAEPYSYTFNVYNSVSGTLVANKIFTGCTLTTNSITFQTNTLWTSNSPLIANVIVTDSASTTAVGKSSQTTLINTVTVGSEPSGAAFTPDGTLAYVTNYASTSVSVINVATNTVINTITVGSDPAAVAITPDGTLAYVPNQGSGTLNVINVATNTVINTITLGSQPDAVAITPDGTLAYVVNYGSGTLNVINVATNTVIKTIPVGSDPVAVAFTPSGNLAYVANLGSDTVNVINVATNTVIKTITVGSEPQDVAITPDGTLAYVPNYGSGTVNVINVATNTVINTITLGSGPQDVAFTPLGTLAYVQNYGSGTVSVINVATNTVINTITVGLDPNFVAFTPDGTLAYVPNYGSGTVSVISTSFEPTIKVNLALTTPTISPLTNTAFDGTVVISAFEANGISPYTYNFQVFNSITNALFANQLAGSNTFSFSANAVMVGNTYRANVFVTDSESIPQTLNSILSGVITANTALKVSFTTSNSPILNAGQSETFTTSLTGGIGPYTYNYIVTNVETGALIANQLYTGVASLSNTFVWTGSGSYAGNEVLPKVTVTDSATTNSIINTYTIAVVNSIPVGIGPTYLAFTPSGNLAYVPDEGTTTVSVINVATNTVINTIPGFSIPYDVAFTPDGTLAYVPNYGSGTVNVINVATNTVIKTITVGSDPIAVAFTPSGNLAYVVNYGSGTLNVINVATNTVINTIPGFSIPYDVAFTPDGTLAYVTNHDATGTVNVIDVATNSVINTITVGTNPETVAINPDGTLAYVTNLGSASVNVINIATNTVINTIPVGSEPQDVAFTPSGALAYVVNDGSGTMSIINVSSNSVITTVSLGSGADPVGVAITPSGNLAYVTNFGSFTVNVITTPTVIINEGSPALSTPTLTLSNTLIDQGQSTLFTASFSGGAVPYSYAYNVYAYNSQTSSNRLIANMLFTGNTYTSNSWLWTPNANLYIGNSLFFANVVVTDSHPTTVNSVPESFGYNSSLAVPTISPESAATYDVGQAITVSSYESGGTQRSTNSVVLPSNILNYIPITITNQQGSALTGNTAIAIGSYGINGHIIGFNALEYQQYYTCNLNNAEFFFANGTIINSWLEGNLLNEQTANAACTSASSPNSPLVDSANILYWVRIPSGSFLAANTGTPTSNTIYLGWATNVISPADTLFNALTGEAPQLSSTYAQYDNGANVFAYYQRFGGLSSLPAGWTQASGTLVFGSTYTEYTASDSNWDVIYMNDPNSFNSYPTVWDTYAGLDGTNPPESFLGTTYNAVNNFAGGGQYGVFQWFDLCDTTHIQFTYSGQATGCGSNLEVAALGNSVYTAESPSATAANAFINYTELATTTGVTNANPNLYFGYAVSIDYPDTGSDYAYWLRSRNYPPNGILPNTTYGGIYGDGAYTYNIIVFNSITNTLIASQLGGISNSLVFTANAAMVGNTYKANVLATDAATTPASMNSINSGLITVNPAMTIPTLTESNSPAVMDALQYETFTASFSGGTSTYTYNYIISNSVTNAIIANQLYVGVFGTSNTFVWQIPSSDAGNTAYVNVTVTDSAAYPAYANSIYTSIITINPAQSTPTLTPSNIVLDAGQTETFTAGLYGGAGGYTVNFFNVTRGTAGYIYGYNQFIQTSNYPISLRQDACASYNSIVYCVGGGSTGGSDDVYYANVLSTSSLGNWILANTYPVSIGSLNCATISNNIYCTGGGSAATYYAPLFANGAVGTWTSTNSYPYALTSPGCISYSSSIECIGGEGTGSLDYNTVYYASQLPGGGLGTWTAANAYPANIDSTSCLTEGSNIYCIGGYAHLEFAATTNVYYAPIFNTGNIGTWTTTNSYPLRIGQPNSCFADSNDVYCVEGSVGGNGEGNQLNYYAPILSTNVIGAWVQTASYPLITGSSDCAQVGNDAYCIGGENAGYTAAYNNVYYAPLTPNGIANTLTWSFVANAATTTNFQYNVIVTDNATIPVTVNSITNTITVSPAMTIPDITTPTPSTQSASNTLTWTTLFTGGSSSYTYDWYVYNTISHSVLTSSIVTNSLPSNAFSWTPGVNYVGNTVNANVIVIDSASTPVTVNSPLSGTVTLVSSYIPPATPTCSAPANTIADSGQYEQITCSGWTGGTSPYAVNQYVFNALSGNIVAFNSIASTTATSATFAFATNAVMETPNSPLVSNVVVTDAHPATVNSAYSSAFSVNQALGVPTLTVSNTPDVDAGQYELFTASFSGGTAPYTYNYEILNTVTLTVVTNELYKSVASTSNTFFFPIPLLSASNTLEVNVIVTDSASNVEITNSVYSKTITVNSKLAVPSIQSTNTLIDQGQITVIKGGTTLLGGSSPYTYNFQIFNSITNVLLANQLYSGVTLTTNSFIWTPPNSVLGNTLYVNLSVTDNAATKETTNSVQLALSVNAALLVGISPTSASVATGQSETWLATVTPGQPSYTYNWLLYNSLGFVSNALYKGNTVASNAFSFTFVAPDTYYANVFVTDSATTPETANSVNSVIIVQNTCSFSVNVPSINFVGNSLYGGSFIPGTNTVGTVNSIAVTDTGGVNTYIFVYGSNWAFNSNNFQVTNTAWSSAQNSLWNPVASSPNSGSSNVEVQLTASMANTLIPVPAGTSNNIYFGVQVPNGEPAGSYTNNDYIISSC